MPACLAVIALPLIVITVEHTSTDGAVSAQCITAELSLASNDLFLCCWHVLSEEDAMAVPIGTNVFDDSAVWDMVWMIYRPDGAHSCEGQYMLHAFRWRTHLG